MHSMEKTPLKLVFWKRATWKARIFLQENGVSSYFKNNFKSYCALLFVLPSTVTMHVLSSMKNYQETS